MKNSTEKSGLRTWMEIDTKALAHNYKVVREFIPASCKLMSVAKSNAYGHSLIDFSLEMQKLGTDWVGVDSIIEAIAIRKAGVTVPIFVLGYTLPEMLATAVEMDISIAVSTFETLEAIAEQASVFAQNSQGSQGSQKIKVHIKVDTGMHRQGFQEGEMSRLIDELKRLTSLADKDDKSAKIIIEGLFTHFAAAKNPAFPADTLAQIALFEKWVSAFTKAGFNPIKHACASGGTFLFPQAHFDMVRVGIALYGLYPSRETQLFMKDKITLKPALSWKTILGEVKKVSRGGKVGYDFTETLQRDTVMGICPIGYWHGFPRNLSSIGYVIVRGKKARVVGRVSMDMINVDLTDIGEVKVGDEVTLIGQDGEEVVSVEDIASAVANSSYEVITRLNPLIKRIYV
ncbi:alanine racemase [Candidatus Parcubacteria bacterium]|nr:alanine racemase [Candidatus Parcubacteria bacterium]